MKEGHAAPMLAIEVVSETHPRKDYVVAPDKYAASGVGEMWIFDPLLSGPASHGGPLRLQVWTRDDDGTFSRSYAGDGPARSPALGAYLVPVDEGRNLRIATDAEATERLDDRGGDPSKGARRGARPAPRGRGGARGPRRALTDRHGGA